MNINFYKFREIIKLRQSLTVLLVIIFELFGLILIPSTIMKESAAAIGLWYQSYILLTGIASIFIILGLWKMKRIGVYIYFISYAVHNIVALIVGNWLVYVLIIPIIGAVLILPYWKKME